MTDADKQKLAEFKKSPKNIQKAAMFAFGLGLLTVLRMVAHAYAVRLPLGKALFYGFSWFCWYFFAGGSLYARNRLGYFALFALILFAFFGTFVLAVHLLRLALEGTLTVDVPNIIHWITVVAQFAASGALLGCLLSKDARVYVWVKPKM